MIQQHNRWAYNRIDMPQFGGIPQTQRYDLIQSNIMKPFVCFTSHLHWWKLATDVVRLQKIILICSIILEDRLRTNNDSHAMYSNNIPKLRQSIQLSSYTVHYTIEQYSILSLHSWWETSVRPDRAAFTVFN